MEIVNDKGERKATGSYYTPDYIVKFIVERTVGPALREAVAGKTSDAASVQAVLEVNVLDPAMGSGHFLVEATEYIARFLVDLGVTSAGQGAGGSRPRLLEAPRGAILHLRRGPESAGGGAGEVVAVAHHRGERPPALLPRPPPAPRQFAGRRPAHRAAGTRARANAKAEREEGRPAVSSEQASLFTDADFTQRMAVAVGSMWIIEESESATVEQVKSQEQQYDELRRQLVGKYGKLADLLTARYLRRGCACRPVAHGRSISSWAARWAAPPAIQQMVQQAVELAARERFFHWELEFPEVFFDRHGRPLGEDGGFEAVIGNPPYVRQEQLAPYKPYLQESLPIFHGMADLYLYFYERGMEETKRGGRHGLYLLRHFCPRQFRRPFRQWLPTVAQMETIIDFGENQPFPGAEMVRPSIVVLRKQPDGGQVSAACSSPGKFPHRSILRWTRMAWIAMQSALEQSEWTFQAREHIRLSQKIMPLDNHSVK